MPNPKQIIIDRYNQSCKHNRNINVKPELVALAAHLFFVKKMAGLHISESGIISGSKLQGLKNWDMQHLADFCELNGVTDIYENGVDDIKMMELVPKYDLLKSHLAKLNSDGE